MSTARQSTWPYVIGFGLSLVLTIETYLLVRRQTLAGWAMVFLLVGLAVTQLMVQLYFFLHLGQEAKPRWNLVVFSFAAVVVTILVGGSLWIMSNLNYHHDHSLSPDQTNKYIIQDEGIKE